MKYDVTYSCGHEGVVDIIGSRDERERKLWWFKNRAICPECLKAEKQAKRAAELETAKVKATDFPELTGSEKQVNWAMTLRQKWYDYMTAYDLNEKGIEIVIAIINSNINAKTWIDNRDKHPKTFLAEEMERLGYNVNK